MNNYFDFIMYLAFQATILYDNRRSISIEELKNYVVALTKEHMKFHKHYSLYNNEEFETKLKSFYINIINMTDEEEINLLKEITNNSDLFTYENGVVKLTDKITYNEFQKLKFNLDYYKDKNDSTICGELINAQFCLKCLNALKLKSACKYINSIISDEKLIEIMYQNLNMENIEEKIEDKKKIQNFRMSLLANIDDNISTYYYRTIINGNSDPEVNNEELSLISNDLINKMEDSSTGYVYMILNNKFQKAIFGEGTLVYEKLNDMVEMISCYKDPGDILSLEDLDEDELGKDCYYYEEHEYEYEDIEDEDEYENGADEIDSLEYEDEFDDNKIMNRLEYYNYQKNIDNAFYLNYINHINLYETLVEVDSSLEKTKTRLLYLLDDNESKLYKYENLKNVINNISMDKFDYNKDFDNFYVLSKYFLIDILEKYLEDDMTLRKLLFISTYYDLTHNEEIIKIINQYNTDIAIKVSRIILEHNYDEVDDDINKEKMI